MSPPRRGALDASAEEAGIPLEPFTSRTALTGWPRISRSHCRLRTTWQPGCRKGVGNDAGSVGAGS